MEGSVEKIALASVESALPGHVEEVEVGSAGMVGDRYGDAGDITLIEAESLEGLRRDTGIELSHEESRRQVLTRGIRLNDLVGLRFRVGSVECVGVELCEPCSHLQSLTYPGVLRGLVHRAGLRADIVGGGRIAVGDAVTLQSPTGHSHGAH
ncbi:MAG TPA: MOSC domain-containing protein [Thermoleophilaceae bacterium]|nr:MOSC domain-containing protein [Thermoleophilaceae bacterium]